jgi:hypothetical protein
VPPLSGLRYLAGLVGSFVPFAATREARLASGDTRPSIAERYAGRQAYLAAVDRAARVLVQQRLMLADDLGHVRERAAAEWTAVVENDGVQVPMWMSLRLEVGWRLASDSSAGPVVEVFTIGAFSPALEELNGALVPFGRFTRLERPQVAATPRLGVRFAAVKSVTSAGELPDHGTLRHDPVQNACRSGVVGNFGVLADG